MPYTGLEPGKLEFRPAFQIIDCRIEKLFYDFWVPFSALQNLEENGLEYTRIFKVLDQAANLVCLRSPYSSEYYDSLETAEKFLQQKFYQETCGSSQAVVDCIGHTHIDVAWLWTLAQTREKAQRSFATVLALMEEYPEYKFMSSQPQLYQYVKDAAPALYEKIKQRVREGRWEVEGAMWLEANCNLPSGESLVRQILYGKQFIKEEFGVDSKILWLPDVFGYSAALPQILRKSGIEYFVTSKISWNDTNKLPYDSFLWKGIDGSEIFTNFLTAQDYPPDGVPVNYSCYNGDITPSMVKGAYKPVPAKGIQRPCHGYLWLWRRRRRTNQKDAGAAAKAFQRTAGLPEDGNPYGSGTFGNGEKELLPKRRGASQDSEMDRGALFRVPSGNLYLNGPKQAVQSKNGISASKGGGTGGGSFSIV